MFCSHCGHSLHEDSRFCSTCGNAVPTPGAHGAGETVATRNVVINAMRLRDDELVQIQRAFGMNIPDGAYWYDRFCGAWGYQGGPTAGFLTAGLPLGGPLRQDASNGATGVVINGRELPVQDVLTLRQVTPVVIPGRFWLDALGNCGFEGGPPLGNLRAMTAQAGTNAGGAWSVSTAAGTAAGDGEGNLFFSGGGVSWSNW